MATNYSSRGHDGKVKYDTRKLARKKARQLMQSTRDSGHISAYKCGVCSGYHIGHNNQHALSVLMEYMPNQQLVFANFKEAA